jgi:hypothetical protein
VAFDTVQEFEDLGESVIPGPDAFALLLLRGYPSPEWLNTLGGRFGIDPEFFQRHLLFASASGKSSSKHSSTQILPSCHGDMISLQITTIGSRQCDRQGGHDQGGLESLRRHTSEEMLSYMSKLGSLNCPGIAPGDSIVRDFSVHDFDYFSLEQTMSLGIHRTRDGWIGIFLSHTKLRPI